MRPDVEAVRLGDGVGAAQTHRGSDNSGNLAQHVGDRPAAVLAARLAVAEQVGAAAGQLVWMDQVHGTRVQVVHAPVDAAVQATDAVVTGTPGLVLAVLTADCVPVLLADPTAPVVAAVHAGRRGLVNGVVAATLASMVELGARPEHTVAWLGPSVCGRCYEVPAELQSEVLEQVPEARAVSGTGTPALDLAAGVMAQLTRAGVPGVRRSPVCTRTSDRLFSYRRTPVTGRQASLVWLA